MVKITGLFDELNSSACKSVQLADNSVIITYNSNKSKEYEFKATDIDEFTDLFVKCIANQESIGKLLHSQIKSSNLVENK